MNIWFLFFLVTYLRRQVVKGDHIIYLTGYLTCSYYHRLLLILLLLLLLFVYYRHSVTEAGFHNKRIYEKHFWNKCDNNNNNNNNSNSSNNNKYSKYKRISLLFFSSHPSCQEVVDIEKPDETGFSISLSLSAAEGKNGKKRGKKNKKH